MGDKGKGDVKAPKFSKEYERGLAVYLKYLPRQLQDELKYRQEYDPQFIEQALGLQHTYDPGLAREQLAAVERRDPEWVRAHKLFGDKVSDILERGYVDPQRAAAYGALGKQVTSDTLRGTTADPATMRQMTQAILSRSPNLSYGEAQDMAAAVYTGQRGQGLQQQRQQATNQFLGQQSESDLALTAGGRYMSTPTMTSMINQTPGVTPPSAMRYVNPNAGYQGVQFALQNYQNLLAQGTGAGSSGSGNPWMNALQGASQGASYGSVGGGYGAAGGAITGGILGAFGYPQYSDARLKTDIVKVGEHNGLDVIEFRYKKGKTRYRGVRAEQVRKKFPEAVSSRKGYLTVDYDKIGMSMERWCKKCERFKPILTFQKNVRARDGRVYLCTDCWDSNHASYRDKYRQDNLQNIQARKTMRLLNCEWSVAIQLNWDRSAATECDICGRPPNKNGMVLDHCHKTGRLRGLLCSNCNTALGLFKDDPAVLRKALQHLEQEGCDIADKEVQ